MGDVYSLKDEARKREEWQKWTDISEYELRLNQQQHQQWLKDMEVKHVQVSKWFGRLDVIAVGVFVVVIALALLSR